MRCSIFKIKKNMHGYTLTEIVVVIVLVGILAILATSIALIVHKEQNKLSIDENTTHDILLLETEFYDQISAFDLEEYTICVYKDKIEAIDIENTYSLLNFTKYPFLLSNGISLTSITSISLKISDGNIICLEAVFDNYSHKILYFVTAATLKAGENNE